MLFTDKVLDEIRTFYVSKISLDNIAIFYDYDSTQEFIDAFQGSLIKPYQIYLQQVPPHIRGLSDLEIKRVFKHIKKVLESPGRVNRILLKQITEAALHGAPVADIIKGSGKTVEELDKIIVKNKLGESFDAFIEQYHAKHRIAVRVAMSKKGLLENDSKALQFLSEKILDDMKEVKPDINVNVDNRSVKIIQMPEAKSIDQLLAEQEEKKKLPPDDPTTST